MNYQELFKIALLLISSPAKAWGEICLQDDRRKVFTGFVYPMIGLCALAVAIGSLVAHGWSTPQSFQMAMTACCAVAVALFGGYYMAAYMIDMLGNRFFNLPADRLMAQQLAGYSMVVVFLTNMVIGLLPDLLFLALVLQLYTLFIVWEGAAKLLKVAEHVRLKYTVVASALLVFCPAMIQFVFNKLLLILN